VLCAILAQAEGALNSNDDDATIVAQSRNVSRYDSVMDLAKKGIVATDKGVQISDQEKKQSRTVMKAHLDKLIPSLKAAAIGVAEKAAVEAATDVTKPTMKKYLAAIHKRVASEKAEALAKHLKDAAINEEDKDAQVALSALKAEQAAATAVTKHSQYAANNLKGRLDVLHSKKKAATAMASASAQQTASKHFVDPQVAVVSKEADQAETEAAAAEVTLQHARQEAEQASKMKDQAIHMMKQQHALQKQLSPDKVVPEGVDQATQAPATKVGRVLKQAIASVQNSPDQDRGRAAAKATKDAVDALAHST